MSERKHFNLDMQNYANFRFVSKSNKARERETTERFSFLLLGRNNIMDG